MGRHAKFFYEFGPFRLDAAERTLLRRGKPVSLTRKAFETLLVLVENNGRVVEKDELMGAVWADVFVEEANLAQNIFRLRKVLGAGSYIETVPRRGYRFASPVRRVRGVGVAAAASSGRRTPGQSGGGAAARGRAGAAINSLAVLPLANASAGGDAEYLCDGITENIINSLSQLPQLRVMARSSVFGYKGREVSARQVGRDLNVRAVLMGRVLELNERLIIRVELVDAENGWQLWGEQYDRRPSDLLEVQGDISREISGKLRLKLTGEQKRRLARRHTGNIEAHRLYLKGRFFWNKRTPEGFDKGIECFNRALEFDPRYAPAYAGLADSYALLSVYGLLPTREVFPKAKAAAAKALEIDDTLAEAHTALGMVRHRYDWDWPGAEGEFVRAIELNPNYATARQKYGELLLTLGQYDRAMAEIRTAQKLDPLSLIINTAVGRTFCYAGQYERALEQFREVIEMDATFVSAHGCLGLVYEQMGRYEEAAASYRRALALSKDDPEGLAFLAHALAMSGRKREARGVLARLRKLSKRRYVSPLYNAIVYLGLGEKAQTFKWLEKSFAEHSELLLTLKMVPTFDSLRPDPRFADLMRRVGFPP